MGHLPTLSIALGHRGVRIGVLFAAGVAAIAASAMIAANGDGTDRAAALGVLVLGALTVLGLKAAAEAVSLAGRSARSNTRTKAAIRTVQQRTAATNRELTEIEQRVSNMTGQVRSLEHETACHERKLIELGGLAETGQNELRRAVASETERLRALEQQHRHHVRQAAHERRARLASTALGDERKSAIDPSDVVHLIEGIESGTIAPERVSDKFPDDAIGLSGRKFRTLVCGLVGLYEGLGAYLEVGIYRGVTLCASAVSNPEVEHIGVDNFSQADDEGRNRSVFHDLIAARRLNNIEFVEQDFHTFLSDRTLAEIRDIAVYYFDASHDYRSQLLALLHGSRQTIHGGVMLVDDCNYSHVRAASYDFCEFNPEWAMLFEQYTAGHPQRVDDEMADEMRDGWWDGVHVLIHDPDFRVERLERQADPTLDRFFVRQHVAANCNTDDVQSRLARVRDTDRATGAPR